MTQSQTFSLSRNEPFCHTKPPEQVEYTLPSTGFRNKSSGVRQTSDVASIVANPAELWDWSL